jgi:hypothetical protein
MDEDNNIFTDYFRWHEATDEELKQSTPQPYKASIRTKLNVINSQGTTKNIAVFDNDRPGPNITNIQHEIGGKAFCVKAGDGIISWAARPLRNHELLRAIGFKDNDVKELTQPAYHEQTKSSTDYTTQFGVKH